MLKGEKQREFVLNYAHERLYFEMATQPLRDVALLLLVTGLQLGEAAEFGVVAGETRTAEQGKVRLHRGSLR